MAAWTQNKSGTLKIDKEAIEHPSKTFPENTSKGVFKASIPRWKIGEGKICCVYAAADIFSVESCHHVQSLSV